MNPIAAGGTPIGLAAKLGFQSVDEFCAKYASSISRGGIYLRVKEPRPIGTVIRLELRLTSGELCLQAVGTVTFTTGTQGEGLPGMGIRFGELDDASRAVVERACAGRPAADSTLPPLPGGVGPALGDYAGSVSAPAALTQPAPQPQPAFSMEPPTGTAATAPERAEPVPASVAAAPQNAPAAPKNEPVVARPAAPQAPPVTLTPGAIPVAHIETPLDRVKKPSEKPTGPIIGIDLGTTYSCAAYVKAGKPFVIPSREGYNTVPSIVAFNQKNRLLIGHPAKSQMLTNPRQTVYGAKRLVGRTFNSPVVADIKDRFNYEIVEGPKGEAAVKLGSRVFSLQELSAMILCEVKDIAQNHLGQPVERAVITVPAYYSDHQRHAVREAGALAGLHVERILNEPTAAALAFGYGRDLKKRILIFDLGGGTFDASLLELHGNIYEVISTGGDTFLGGVDFDMQVVDHLLREFEARAGAPFQGDRVALQRLIDAAERAKIALSESESTQIRVPFLTIVAGKPYDLDVPFNRNQLVELTRGLVERTLAVCDNVLKARGLTVKDVDEIVPVGGMSRMPLVRQMIEAWFGKPPHKGVHPDEAVAMGAALLAYSLEQLSGVVLIDVLPMSIGIGLPGGRFKRIIERNTSLPHSRSYTVATTRDDQRELEIAVFQGDEEHVQDNEFLGTLKLSGLPKGARGAVRIEVTFDLTSESLLTVTAKELSSGKAVTATLATHETSEAVKARLAPNAANAPATTSGEHQAITPSSHPGKPLPNAGLSSPKAKPTKPGGLLSFFKSLVGR